MSDPIQLAAAARYTETPPLSHQLAAWNWLQEQQSSATIAQFAELFRADPTPTKAPLTQDATMLSVPYFGQNDNLSGTGYRECFSSSCAMLAAFWGKVGSDDEYNVLRARYGDTTDTSAHVETLQSLGLKARLILNGTVTMLITEINHQRPVAVGWLHRGTPQAPSGGGHWSVLVGYIGTTSLVMHDPNGEADLVRGGYVNHTGGRGVVYSRKNWLPRWSPTPATGWAVTAEPA